jgi:hypothetical protein
VRVLPDGTIEASCAEPGEVSEPNGKPMNGEGDWDKI